MQPNRAQETDETKSTLNRRLRGLRQIADRLARSKMSPLQLSEALIEGRVVDPLTRRFFSGLPAGERHYWISSLYALRMSVARRRRLAAYFTPPHLVRHVMAILAEEHIEPGRHRILDPASGGAAFLVPLAAAIADSRRKRGVPAESILRAIESTLAGIEIDSDLSQLSRLLVADLLRRERKAAGRAPKLSISTADTLKLTAPPKLYDAIVANPPYGRIFRPKTSVRTRFSAVISGGYVNVYALFIELALQWVRPGGVICLIVPMSFVGGPYFAALRKRILDLAHVVRLDLIDKRSDVFLDVLYDVGVLVLRKKGGAADARPATSSLLQVDKPPQSLGRLDLPERASDRIWALPDGTLDDRLFQDGLATLRDYGYLAKTGYFVWNREQHRYRRGFTPRPTEVPLFWAHNIRPNRVCKPCDGLEPDRIGLVKVRRDHQAVVQTDAILLQRTTNRGQRRRLVAAMVRTKSVPGDGAFVSENHTIVLIPDPNRRQTVSISTLCRLLNTAAVDARFRRMSGSVSVSTKALRELPLPSAAAVRACFTAGTADSTAAESAYAKSLGAEPKGSRARKKRARRDAR